MKKTFNYNGKEYTIVKTGYGQFEINGVHTTDSELFDYCDDDTDTEKHERALIKAERLTNEY